MSTILNLKPAVKKKNSRTTRLVFRTLPRGRNWISTVNLLCRGTGITRHNAIELFYMESGELNYYTPHKNIVFPAGSAGMVNANVLHKTQIQTRTRESMQDDP